MAEPRVLFLGHGAERTGPPIVLGHLLRWIGQHTGAAVTVAVARDGPLVAEYRATGAEVVVAAHRSEPAEPVVAALRRAGRADLAQGAGDRWLRHRLRHLTGFDLVVVNTASPATARLLANLPAPAPPLVTWVHELDVALRHGLGDHDRASLLEGSAGVVAASEAVAANLVAGHRVAAARVRVHHEFTDVGAVATTAGDGRSARRRLGLAGDAFVVGSVGLPDWRKAPDLLLHAAWRLRRRDPDLDLGVVWVGGDPAQPQRWQLHDEAHRLGLGDRCRFLPHDPEPARWLGALDVFALPAREDAFPLAALEAAAAGRPVVAFDSGGVTELVGDDAGVVVPYPDVDAFAAALGDLAHEPDRRRRLGQTGARRVTERHDRDVAAPALWTDLRGWAGAGPVP